MKKELLVATVDELPEGSHKVVTVAGREMGIFNIHGEFYAIPNSCIHQNGPLCLGATSGTVIANVESEWKPVWTHEGEVVVCPWHSLEFNVITGRCLAYPNKKLPTYRLRVDGNQLLFPTE